MLALGAIVALGLPTAQNADSLQAGASQYNDWYAKSMPTGKCLSASEKRAQLHQDQWALEVADCKRGGYYVDIGSNDGETISNSFTLDTKFGWSGLCTDPFPHGMEKRSCAVSKSALWDQAGKEVVFDHTSGDDGVFSKLDDLESGRDGIVAHLTTEKVTLVTKTAQQVFDEHGVPATVDFLSLDVEGAEIHVLKSMDFTKHCFRAVAIEHNFQEPNRSQMRSLLEAKGYTYSGSEEFDDYYTKVCA